MHCTIIGNGPMKSELSATVNNLQLNDIVTFIGHIPHADIRSQYANADLLVAPSIIAPDGDRDGLPNVILEAMAAGVPVVASRLSGIPEAVRNEETGLLVPPGDEARLAGAVQRMVHDRELRRKCIEAARKTVEADFNYRDNARQMYETILDCEK
jgi:glycosyltransferase involved in cell wall biosynthesis